MDWFKPHRVDGHGEIHPITHHPETVSAPEMNAGSGLTAITLLAGLLAVLIGERRRSK
jgi:hypothetical protein